MSDNRASGMGETPETAEVFRLAAKPPSSWTTEEALKVCFANYEKRPDGSFFVHGSLHMQGRNLSQLPDLSRVDIETTFFCQNNNLTSLKGSPRSVGGDFWCNNNKLADLEGATPKIGGSFWCHENPALVSLRGTPAKDTGHLYCKDTALETLEDAPRDDRKILSDMGDFDAWTDVPAQLRVSEARIDRHTVLQTPIKASQPIRLRLKS